MALKFRLYKLAWMIVWYVSIRPFPRKSVSKWYACALRLFGAKVGKNCDIYSSAKILVPNLFIMDDYASLADNTLVQNTALIHLKSRCVVSQYSYLCAGSHDIWHKDFAPISKPIVIGERAWVAANCIVCLGVTVGDGAVLSAGSVVFENIEPWTVVCGNPAKKLIKRRIFDDKSIDYK